MDIRGEWKDYRRFWADKHYTIEESDASEVLRVKFYRAKNIYEKLYNKFFRGSKLTMADITYYLEGYCEGVRADSDTKDILLWLLEENYLREYNQYC